jgi:hypothetical protein
LPFNHYHFVSNWRVLGGIEEVYALISDATGLRRWWPAAFTDVLQIQPGDDQGVDRVVRFESKSWLPFSLLWHANTVEAEPPHRFRFEAWGDLAGAGEWRLHQDGAWTDLTFDWEVTAKKPALRYLGPLLRPLFIANQEWLMAKGEASLRLELAKRAASNTERVHLPAPPPPAQFPALPLALIAAAIIAFAVWRSRKR